MHQSRSATSSRTVYLSYSIFETELAIQLAADLRAAGYRVWCDRLDVNSKEPLHEQVKQAIRSSAVLVSILSPAYLKARYARLEWEFAAKKRYPIVPVLAGPVRVGDLPPEIILDAHLDFSEWRSEGAYQTQFPQLLAALDQRGPDGLRDDAPPHVLDQHVIRTLARLNMRQAAAEIHEMPDKYDGAVRLALRPPSPIEQVWGRPSMVRVFETADATSVRLMPFADALAAFPRRVITGGPGAGKSAALERLTLDAALAYSAAPETEPLPLWLSLADWAGDDRFEAFLGDAWSLLGLSSEPLEDWLQQGRTALYLDGLNEMGGWGEDNAAQLRDWLAAGGASVRVTIACRTRDANSLADLGLPRLEILPLDENSVTVIVRAQLGLEESGRFLKELAAVAGEGERAGLPDLACAPASLNGLMALYRSAPQGKPPATLGGLFKRMLPSAWLCKRIEQMPGWMPFMPVESALASVAQWFLREEVPLSAPAELFFNSPENDAALRAARNAGLIEVRDGRLRFASKLLLEYFAAVGTTRHDLLAYLRGARFDERSERAAGPWDMVVLLMAGMTPNPESLIRDIAEIDPFLAADCLASGVIVNDSVYDSLIASLVHFARGRDAGGQAAAALALNAVARQTITPTLLDVMRTGSWHGRLSALKVLRVSEAPVPPSLLRALRGWNWTPQEALAQPVRDAGEDAVALMLTVLDDPEWSRRRGAAWALGVLNDQAAVPGLVLALTDEDGLVRREAAEALGVVRDPAALPALLDGLSDSDLPVRRAVAAAIVNLGESALPALQERLAQAPAGQRTALADILGGLGAAESVAPLVGLAADAEPSVRAAAVTALGKLAHPDAVPILSECLTDTVQPLNVDEPICYLAAAALRAIGTPEALRVVDAWRTGQTPAGIKAMEEQAAPASESDVLLVQIASPVWETRRDAVSALALRGDRTYLPLIAESLTDEDTQVRWAAARSLGDFAYDPASVDALIKALADPEALVADEAVSSLGRIGSPALPAVLTALRSRDPNVRAAAVDALGKIGDPSAVKALKKLSRDKAKAPREGETIAALAAAVVVRLSAKPALLNAEKSPPESEPPQELPPSPVKKQPMLEGDVKKLDDEPETPLPAPVEPLPAAPPPNPEPAPAAPVPPAVEQPAEPPPKPDVGPDLTIPEDGTWADLTDLLAALRGPDWDTRQNAAKQLRAQARGLRGLEDAQAISQLADALRDDDYSVRWAVVSALAWLRDDTAVPMLLEAMHDKHFTVRLAVIRAFEEIGSPAVAPALVEHLRDPHALVREKAAEALGVLRAPDADEALNAALRDREPFVRRAAAEALGELRGPLDIMGLTAALEDDDAFVRMAAAEALGRLGDAAAVPALTGRLFDYGGAEWDQQHVCDVAAAALEAIGTKEAMAAVEQWRRKLDELRRGQ
ncbi:MAG TPA: HEAT repeat domain-containing protein [Candidatus Limnocylindrales bacterium]|nr:HEAT repeat domain-containing protein [Candidatus Limnocylindrales bacterium]